MKTSNPYWNFEADADAGDRAIDARNAARTHGLIVWAYVSGHCAVAS